jgi:prophage regulatory protein
VKEYQISQGRPDPIILAGHVSQTLEMQQGVGSDWIARLETVSLMTGLSKSSIYAGMADDTFPRSVKLGKRAVGWRIRDIQAWLNSREQSGS